MGTKNTVDTNRKKRKTSLAPSVVASRWHDWRKYLVEQTGLKFVLLLRRFYVVSVKYLVPHERRP